MKLAGAVWNHYLRRAIERAGKMYIAVESLYLAVICLVDLMITVLLVANGQFIEGNPIMRFYLYKGPLHFVAVKMFLVLMPIAVGEWYRRRNPVLVRKTMRVVICAYVGVYALGFVLANLPWMSAGGHR
jgi:hypothetical protein